MNLENVVTEWLHAEAPKRAPAQLLSVTLERVAVVPQDRVLWRRRSATRRRGGYRPLFALAATLVALGLLGGLAIFGRRPDHTPMPTTTPATNGWLAYTASSDASSRAGIYLVRQGQSPHRIGAVSDVLNQWCPTFSPDGYMLAYGQAEGTDDSGYTNAVVVIADIDAQGNVSASSQIAVSDISQPPCVVWSPDGERLAFNVKKLDPAERFYQRSRSEVRVLDLDDGHVSVIPDTLASDIEWSPDGSRLAIASGKEPRDPRIALPGVDILLYSAVTGALESLPGTPDANWVTWAPDSSRIAYDRGGWDMAFTDGQYGLESTVGDPGELRELFVRDLRDGQDQKIASGYKAMHGIGPVWSPNADQIVYQRICEVRPDGPGSCHEEHEVVVVSAGAGSSWRPSDVTETVLPYVTLPDSGDGAWLPFRVTWSPDGESLLYLAWGPVSEPVWPSAWIVVPFSSASAPVKLAEDPDISVYTGDYGVTIQNWGREQLGQAAPALPGAPPTPEDPTPTSVQPTGTPTEAPPSLPPISQPIQPGLFSVPRSTWSYFSEPVDPPNEITADFQVPGGWLTDGATRLFKAQQGAPDGIGLQIGTVTGVYADPCRWSSGMTDLPAIPLGDSHDYADMANALARDEATVEKGLLGGFGSWELTLDTPQDISSCDYGEFRRWEGASSHPRFEHRPGQIDRIWLVGTNSEMVVIHAWYFADTTAADQAEMLDIVQSLWFTQHGD